MRLLRRILNGLPTGSVDATVTSVVVEATASVPAPTFLGNAEVSSVLASAAANVLAPSVESRPRIDTVVTV